MTADMFSCKIKENKSTFAKKRNKYKESWKKSKITVQSNQMEGA
jgi:hypothetical protein